MGDVNFSDLEISVRRSIYRGTIGDCKTETSRKPVPVNERVAADHFLNPHVTEGLRPLVTPVPIRTEPSVTAGTPPNSLSQ